MVGIKSFQESFSIEAFRSKSVSTKTQEGKGQEDVQSIRSLESFSFSMNYSKAMQVIEGESKQESLKSMSMEFSISVDFSGKLSASPISQEEAAQLSEKEDPFSPENTANRIVDFIKQAFSFTKAFGQNPLENDSDIAKFRTAQEDAVKKGFGQARSLLGDVDEKTDGGINSTFDLVFKGLEDFFSGLNNKDKQEPKEVETTSPANGNFYSSQSFSLSYQVSISAEGNFSEDELNSFIDDSFKQVNDIFGKFIGGGEEEGGFNPFDLISSDSLDTEKIGNLLEA
ncbi:MAG: hypothetical protein COB02_14960 [Candidatus Cloacimonadota bacterium]|nr:MAG: hypothetical protein COB02_14960 [Candidatus Cloacimonadota bacterium]